MSPSAPAQNRVTPCGDIVAVPGRGAWMGNRGRLHEGSGTRVVVRNHQGRAWIICRLAFKDWRAAQWEPNHYTPLFFLDEAVAFAAGHRPCAECRRADYNAYRAAWAQSHGGTVPYAAEMDARLHAERLPWVRRAMPWPGLPDGVFVETDAGPAVVLGDHLAVWDEHTNSYRQWLARPRAGEAAVLTPPASVAVLAGGYPVQVDPGARDAPG